MADYYTDPEGRIHLSPGVDFKEPLVRTGQGDYRRDYTPSLPRPLWSMAQAWWRTFRNPFSLRKA